MNVSWLANLKCLCSLFGCSIVFCSEAKVILVLFTVHVFVNGLLHTHTHTHIPLNIPYALCLQSCNNEKELWSFAAWVFSPHLAEEAVCLVADVAGELVDIVFKYTPAGAVQGFTVVTILTTWLSNIQPQLQNPLVLLRCQELEEKFQTTLVLMEG